jgi:hypothetical protein
MVEPGEQRQVLLKKIISKSGDFVDGCALNRV